MSKEILAIETIQALSAFALTSHLLPSTAQETAKDRSGCHSSHRRRVHQINFEVTEDAQQRLCAKCEASRIQTQAESWDALRANIRQAVEACFHNRTKPERIHLHIVRDQTLELT